ncbi:hypothetical protein ACWKSP_38410 [Micromonosporaceae bacterium Da 78-11]
MDPIHLRLAEIGLRVAGRYGFALAGGYAVQAHFLDVDAAVVTGRFTREQLLDLAEQADAGFDRRIFADLLAMLQRYPDKRFAAYEATPDHITAMRVRFAQWRDQLLADQP